MSVSTEKYIQDPLYGGYMLDDPTIMKLASTFEISRLSSIKQANLTSIVFPGANHTRFEHTMGTVYLMDRIFKTLIRKASTEEQKKVLEEESRLMNIVALLHDMCAFPFSHVLEYSFRQIAKIDEYVPREDLFAFDGFWGDEDKKLFLNELDHELVRDDILGEKIRIKDYYKKYYPEDYIENTVIDVLKNEGIDIDKIIRIYKGEDKNYLTQLIDGDIDVDRMDHLVRDSYYSGIKHAVLNIERLIDSMEIHDGNLTIGAHMGVPQAVHLMAARELLYDSFYNHQEARVYEAMFCRAVFKLLVDIRELDIDELLFLTDDVCLRKLQKLANDEGNAYAFVLLNRVKNKDPLELIFEVSWPDIRTSGYYTPERDIDNMIEELRFLDHVMKIEEEIASEVGIQPQELVIHRDNTKDDPRRVMTLPDVPVKIMNRIGERPKDLGHYHKWVNEIKMDWKERWSVRIYTTNVDKKEEIKKAISERFPVMKSFE